MSRLWRAATLVLVATALTIGPAATALATSGDTGGIGDVSRDRVTDRAVDAAARPAPSDRPADRPTDRGTDRVTDRAVDKPADRVVDQPTDRVTDRVRDREHRPECDPDQESDRVHDCRPDHPEIRPALARCIEYVQSRTDRVIRRNLRWWVHVCHRIAWNHNNPD